MKKEKTLLMVQLIVVVLIPLITYIWPDFIESFVLSFSAFFRCNVPHDLVVLLVSFLFTGFFYVITRLDFKGHCNDDCEFCTMNVEHANVVDETDEVKVIINQKQQSLDKGCVAFMIVPKHHKTKFSQLTEAEWCDILLMLKMYAPQGCDHNLLVNCGKSAGQTQDHFHLHFFSRFEGDGIVNMSRPERKEIMPQELERLKLYLLGVASKK